MERKLRQLFDYQKFHRNPRLEAMLSEAEGRSSVIEDDALEMVSAAGDPFAKTHGSDSAFLPPDKKGWKRP